MYHSLSELQKDLDSWLNHYNTQRTQTGKYCIGKTPMQTFIDSLQLAKDKLLDEVFKIKTLEDNKKMTEVPIQSSNPEFNWNAVNMLSDR
ncbi:hypothetical protein [Emticicia fluvialis]|uniref:hypothetical protein n=1 Tax=Emticicia fluvialis TaxID=2974474 RepID=UPI0036F3F351